VGEKFSVEQLLAPNTLILDLEPRRSLRLRDVIPKTADPLKQSRAILLDVFDVSHSHSGNGNHRQQTPEFVLAVCQSLSA
jgi:hypothetical protein